MFLFFFCSEFKGVVQHGGRTVRGLAAGTGGRVYEDGGHQLLGLAGWRNSADFFRCCLGVRHGGQLTRESVKRNEKRGTLETGNSCENFLNRKRES